MTTLSQSLETDLLTEQVEVRSLWQTGLRRLFRQRNSIFGATILSTLIVVALLAPVIACLVTDRTLLLIEHRSTALDFLTTGRIPRSLRRSEHFDDLVHLARCDRDGRVPGAEVSELDEALDYIAGLDSAWDDV